MCVNFSDVMKIKNLLLLDTWTGLSGLLSSLLFQLTEVVHIIIKTTHHHIEVVVTSYLVTAVVIT